MRRSFPHYTGINGTQYRPEVVCLEMHPKVYSQEPRKMHASPENDSRQKGDGDGDTMEWSDSFLRNLQALKRRSRIPGGSKSRKQHDEGGTHPASALLDGLVYHVHARRVLRVSRSTLFFIFFDVLLLQYLSFISLALVSICTITALTLGPLSRTTASWRIQVEITSGNYKERVTTHLQFWISLLRFLATMTRVSNPCRFRSYALNRSTSPPASLASVNSIVSLISCGA